MYEPQKLAKLLKALIEHNACSIYSAEDKHGEVVAANVILRDESRCYLQFLTQMNGRDGNIQSVLVFHAISRALEAGYCFDFEGSMLPGVCEFYASYNPEWELYHRIYKYSPRYKVLEALRDYGKGLIGK